MKKTYTFNAFPAVFLKLSLALLMVLWVLPQSVQAQQLTILKSASSNMVQSGETVTFTLSGGCTSELNNCTGAMLMDFLPGFMEPELPIPAITIMSGEGGGAFMIRPTYDSDNRKITWDFTSIQPEGGLPDGASFVATYTVTIPAGEVPDGTVISNMAEIMGDTGVPVSSSEDIAVEAEPRWEISKSLQGSRPIYHDEEVTYQIVVDPVSSMGNTNLTDVVVTDVLPEGAELVSIPAGATYDMFTRTLTWILGDLDVSDGPVVLDVTVTYPYTDVMGEPNFTGPDMVIPKINTASLEGDIQGDENNTLDLSDTEDAPLNPPVFEIGLVKTADNSGNIPVGLTNRFNLGVSNESTREVDNFIVRDQIPPQFDLERVGFNGFPAGFPVTVTITLSDNSTQSLSVTTSDEIDILTAFTLGTEYVTDIEFDFGTVPFEFMGSIALSVSPNQAPDGSLVDNTGAPYNLEEPYTNSATLDAVNPLEMEDIEQATSSEDMCILPEDNTRVDLDKSVEINYETPPAGDMTTGNPYFPGSRVRYTLNVENDGPDGNIPDFVSANTSTATLVTPIVTDLLPAGLTYDGVTGWAIVNNNAPTAGTPSFSTIPNFDGAGATLLVWEFPGDLEVNEDLQIQFNAFIDDDEVVNFMGRTVTNEYAIGSPDPSSVLTCGGVECGTPETDVASYFPGGSGVTAFCSATESFDIRFETAIPYVEKSNTTGTDVDYIPTGVNVPNASNTVQFTTTFGNDPMASVPLPNFVAFDLLPEEVDYVPGSLALLSMPANSDFNQPLLNITANVDEFNDSPVMPAPASDDVFIEIIENYMGTNRTLIRWSFTGEFRIADGVSYSFNTQIRQYESGDFSNSAGISAPMFNDIEIDCPNNSFTFRVDDDPDDLDGDSNTTGDDYCSTEIPVPVNILDVTEMNATKFVRGENDAMYLRPGPGSTNYDYDEAEMEGLVDWRLEVENPGNVTLENVRIYDIFPYVGDVGVQNTGEDRDSEWQPNFFSFSNITVGGDPYDPTQMTIEYSTDTNPCRSEIFVPPFMEPVDCDPIWTDWQTLSGTPDGSPVFATIRAIRITFVDPLAPGDIFMVDVQQEAPDYGTTGIPPGAIAWNSIARVASTDPTFSDQNALQVPPQEPNKVGVRLEALDLAVRKELCDTQDRDVDPGDPVCFDLTIINQGSTTATSITLSDYNQTDFDLVSTGWTAESNQAGLEVSSRVLTPGNGLPAGGLAPGAQVVIQVEYTVIGTAPFGSTVVNRIEISAAEDEFDNDRDYDGDFDDTPLNDVGGGVGVDGEDNNVDGNAFDAPPTDEDNEDPAYVCVINLFAGDDMDVCPNQGFTLMGMVDPDPAVTTEFDVNWSTSGTGTFVDASGNVTTDYTEAEFYIPSPEDAVLETVTLTITTSGTPGGLCDGLSDDVVLTFLAGCGTFPAPGSGAYCDGPTPSPMDPSGAIQVSSVAGTFFPGPDNVQEYILAQAGTILAVNSTGTFTSLVPGDYEVYAINYLAADLATFAPFLQPGQPVSPLVMGGTATSMGALANECFQVCGGDTFTVPNCYSVGSTLFIDNNNDGIFDQDTDGVTGTGSDEVGIAGVTVELLDDSGNVIATTTTDADGNYYFGGLDAGDYQINIPTTPAGHPNSSAPAVTDTDPDNGDDNDDNGIQSEAFAATTSAVFTLGDGPEPSGTDEDGEGGDQDDTLVDGNSYDENGDMTIDFGFVPSMSIGSFVWVDANNDGLFGPGEMGLDGIEVELYADLDGDGNFTDLVATTTTMNGGEYFFDALFPGDYVVSLPAANFDPGAPGESFPTSSGPTNTLDLGAGNIDNDDNGIQDGGSGTVINSPVINLTYNEEPTEGPDATFPGSEQDNDSPTNEETNGDMTIDFGLVPAMSIGSTVFFDANDNGMQDDDEDGIEGVVVTLYSVNPDGTPGAVIATTTTDENGDYFFGGLAIDEATDFIVGIVPPAATPLSSSDIGTTNDPNNNVDGDDNGTQDSAGDPIFSNIVTLTPGQEPTAATGETESGSEQDDTMGGAFDNQGNMTVDFGLIPAGSIGSTVFLDENNDGLQDPVDDAGVEGIQVDLYLADDDGNPIGDPIATTTTGPNGEYIFTGLPPGDYVVGIPTPPADYLLSSSGANNDENVDGPDSGIQAESGGPTFSGPVTLTAGNEPTAGNGEDASNGGQDEDDDMGPDALMDEYGDMTVDFGFTPAVSVGSTVFVDLDNDGIHEPTDGENGIPNVTVELYADLDGDGNFTDLVATTMTDSNGNYFFGGLPQGEYQIVIPTPDSNFPTSSTPTVTDPLDNTDGDDNGAQPGGSGTQVVSPVFELTADDEPTNDGAPGNQETESGFNQDDADDNNGNMTFDFGFFGPVSLGDYTWFDVNGNGVQDDGEPPVEGVMVTVFNADRTPVMFDAEGNAYVNTTTTDATGFYEFTNLPPGDYYVVFDQSTSDGGAFLDFTVNTAPNGTTNSDADPTSGQSPNTGFLPAGTNFPDLDAGLICNIEVEAGTPQTICSTGAVELALLGATISPTVTGFAGNWSTSGNGIFRDADGNPTTRFDEATSYTPGSVDRANGSTILTLTTDDPMVAPFNNMFCGPEMDQVTITILNVDCGEFPWDGGN